MPAKFGVYYSQTMLAHYVQAYYKYGENHSGIIARIFTSIIKELSGTTECNEICMSNIKLMMNTTAAM